MRSHQGLPRKVPHNKTRPKIFYPITASSKQKVIKSHRSPQHSGDKSTQQQTSQKQSLSLNKNHQHQLKSKQKPVKYSPVVKDIKSKKDQHLSIHHHNDKKALNKSNNCSQKQKDTEFVSTILQMMEPLVKRDKQNKSNLNNQVNNQLNYKSTRSFNCNQQTTNSLKDLLESQTLAISQSIDQEMINKCSNMLKDRTNWSSYNGELMNQKKTGYGILYFKNKDKFMGGFKDDKAYGHGTYYDHQAKRRIIGLWEGNQIASSHQVIVEKM